MERERGREKEILRKSKRNNKGWGKEGGEEEKRNREEDRSRKKMKREMSLKKNKLITERTENVNEK